MVQSVWFISLMACSVGRAPKMDRATLNPSPSGFTEPPQVQSVLEESAASTEIMIRAKALDALVRAEVMTGSRVWVPRGLWDPEPWIQWNTAEAMFHQTLNSDSQSLLIDLIRRESVPAQIRCPIAFRLGAQYASTLLPLIQPEYTVNVHGQARLVCALTGWTLGDNSAESVVLSTLKNEGIPMDPYFLQMLGEMVEKVDSRILVDLMDWAEEGVDLRLAGVLAGKGVPEGWERLQRGLNSDDELEGLDSLDVLLSIKSPRVMSILRSQTNLNMLSGIGASMYLEIVQDRKPVLLRAHGSSDDRDERALAIEMAARGLEMTVSSRMTRECRDLLTAGMTDDAWVVRLASYQALRHHATVPQLEKMAELLTQVDASERLEVAMAIRYRMSGQ